MKVMIIDDSLMVRTMVGRTLSGAGYTVVEANDGDEGLAKLAANADTKMIVCDVNMPRMGGIEFLEALSGGARAVPVVMLTTEGQPELMQRAKALGAKGWIVKPFRPGTSLAVARKLAA